MEPKITQLQQGELWQALVTKSQAALQEKALQPIITKQSVIPDGGIDFLVRIAASLRRKEQQKQQARREESTPFNPFLPPEPALTLGRILSNHIAVLNKFNVVDHHLLIVTDEFEHQETLLTEEDFTALCWCLREYDAVGFYNGGREAGASQMHKHLQLVPKGEVANGQQLPLEKVLPKANQQGILRLGVFPFAHAFSWLEWPSSIEQAGKLVTEVYRQLLTEVGIQPLVNLEGDRQSAPYNLIVTRDWMLLIPRSAECSNQISINALGYLGSLFIPQPDLLDIIRTAGPIALLAEVSQH
jgi:ATP adenylyltransferase